MNLNDFKILETYVGVIESIDYTTWIVKFKVPGLIDNLEEYPEASPLFNHTYTLSAGDEIFIIKPNKIQNDTYMYLPITIYKQIGLWYFKNIIDLTNDGVISVKSDNLLVNIDKVIEINVGKCKISIGKNGNVNIEGNLIVSGDLSSTSGGNGSIISAGGTIHNYSGGVIK